MLVDINKLQTNIFEDDIKRTFQELYDEYPEVQISWELKFMYKKNDGDDDNIWKFLDSLYQGLIYDKPIGSCYRISFHGIKKDAFAFDQKVINMIDYCMIRLGCKKLHISDYRLGNFVYTFTDLYIIKKKDIEVIKRELFYWH